MSESREAAERLRRLMNNDWEWSLAQYPEMATRVGRNKNDDRWTRRSPEAIATRQQHVRASLAELLAIDRQALPAAEHLNYDFYRHQLHLEVAGQQFPEDLLPINQMSGVQASVASTILLMPVARAADYENLVARLAVVPQVVDETIALMQQGVAAGITVPRIALRDVPDQIRAVMAKDGPLLRPFDEFPDSFSQEEQAAWRARAAEVMVAAVTPAYGRLLAYMEEQYIPAARESVGLGQVPGGAAWYAHAIRESTSTEMTAEAIHRLGLAEVKRIRGLMEQVIAATGFTGDF